MNPQLEYPLVALTTDSLPVTTDYHQATGAGEALVLVGIDKKFWLMVLALVIALILLAAWAMRGSG
jgi:hypothetical protein